MQRKAGLATECTHACVEAGDTLGMPRQTSVRLLQLLFSSDNRPFAASLQSWRACFSPQDCFCACCSALLLLEESCALSTAQRLATWFLISQAWPSELATSSPFTCCLAQAAAKPDVHPAERNLLLQLLLHHEQQQQQQQQKQAPQASSLDHLLSQTPLQYVLSRHTPLLNSGSPDALVQRHLRQPSLSALPLGSLGLVNCAEQPQSQPLPTGLLAQHPDSQQGLQSQQQAAATGLARAAAAAQAHEATVPASGAPEHSAKEAGVAADAAASLTDAIRKLVLGASAHGQASAHSDTQQASAHSDSQPASSSCGGPSAPPLSSARAAPAPISPAQPSTPPPAPNLHHHADSQPLPACPPPSHPPSHPQHLHHHHPLPAQDTSHSQASTSQLHLPTSSSHSHLSQSPPPHPAISPAPPWPPPPSTQAHTASASHDTSQNTWDFGTQPSSGVPPPLLVRPQPGILPVQPGELEWLGPGAVLHTGPVWDSSSSRRDEEAEAIAGARELLARALRGPLLPAQQQQVLSALEAHPKLVHRIGIAPRHLPALVEHTPVIAYELLLRLMRGPHIQEFFSVLANTCMSLHSMEVVNRLTTAADLPTEFVHLYISNCISSCENTQDKYVQNRLVRLVCVFLHSLIRNRIVNIADLLHEVQSFCINFSRIREAAKLFRLLKAAQTGLEPGGP